MPTVQPSDQPTAAGPLAVADAFIAAYNANDADAIRAILADDLRSCHHNRIPELHGPDALLEWVVQHPQLLEYWRYEPAYRRIEAGDHAILEHTWEARAKVDVPGFAAEGETIRLDLCSVFTLRDGKIVEFDDYG